jgi:hypothetical protein
VNAIISTGLLIFEMLATPTTVFPDPVGRAIMPFFQFFSQALIASS